MRAVLVALLALCALQLCSSVTLEEYVSRECNDAAKSAMQERDSFDTSFLELGLLEPYVRATLDTVR
mgnify:CR=1 FL=1